MITDTQFASTPAGMIEPGRYKGDRVDLIGWLSPQEAVDLAYRLLQNARFGDNTAISVENYWASNDNGHSFIPTVQIRVIDVDVPFAVLNEDMTAVAATR